MLAVLLLKSLYNFLKINKSCFAFTQLLCYSPKWT